MFPSGSTVVKDERFVADGEISNFGSFFVGVPLAGAIPTGVEIVTSLACGFDERGLTVRAGHYRRLRDWWVGHQ